MNTEQREAIYDTIKTILGRLDDKSLLTDEIQRVGSLLADKIVCHIDHEGTLDEFLRMLPDEDCMREIDCIDEMISLEALAMTNPDLSTAKTTEIKYLNTTSENIVLAAKNTRDTIVAANKSNTLHTARAAFDAATLALSTPEAQEAYKQIGWLGLNLITGIFVFFGKHTTHGGRLLTGMALRKYMDVSFDVHNETDNNGWLHRSVRAIDKAIPGFLAVWMDKAATYGVPEVEFVTVDPGEEPKLHVPAPGVVLDGVSEDETFDAPQSWSEVSSELEYDGSDEGVNPLVREEAPIIQAIRDKIAESEGETSLDQVEEAMKQTPKQNKGFGPLR